MDEAFMSPEQTPAKRSQHSDNSSDGLPGLLTSVKGTYLPSSPLFTNRPFYPMFLNLHKCGDVDIIRGALKASIFDHTASRGMHSGTIDDLASQTLFAARNVVPWLRGHGLSAQKFRGIHTTTFYTIANGRAKMSVDLYIEQFIPRLAQSLKCAIDIPGLSRDFIEEAIIFPLFQYTPKVVCQPRTKMLNDFASVKREFFSQRAFLIQNALNTRVKSDSDEDIVISTKPDKRKSTREQ
ncbi:unnamed protein product [Echinostoma caproni]|uniref:Uncharacterized protein n=1 Tax=Echinostoma caproni TaxID=27848 RepID=A0A183AKE7_9TREM|nr:unnamed protein product [Echinostoma caproni]